MKIDVETRSEYFDSMKDYYPEDFIVDEYKSYRLSIEDMRTIYAQRDNDLSHACYDINLKKDNHTGLLYVNYNFLRCDDLLLSHLYAEQLYAEKENVDWGTITRNYDYEVIKRIEHILKTPLVWVPTEEAAEYCVVSGKVAKEIDTPEGYDDVDRYQFCKTLREKGLLWFADNLPEYSDEFSGLWRYHNMLPKIVLWDRLLETSFEHFHSSDMIRNLRYIAENRGVARVSKIVERFREEWPYIERRELFGILGLDDWKKKAVLYNKDAFFDEIGLHLREWEEEYGQKAEPSNSRGPKETIVFKDSETAEREKERFLSFINRHKMSEDDVDAAWDNRVNQVAVCFYRVWKEKKMLTTKAGGTSLSRFIIDCGLSISVKEKAHGNALNRMINSTDLFTNWIGEVRASF